MPTTNSRKTGKRERDEEEPESKRAKPAAPLGIRWYSISIDCPKPQEAAFADATKETFPLKHGTFEFGNYPNKSDFVEDWCGRVERSEHLFPIYEILRDGPTKFYADIEAIFPGAPPPNGELKQWITDIIAVFQSALNKVGVSDKAAQRVLTTYDCRPCGHGFKRSFHLTWPGLMFQNNHTAMKQFVRDEIMPQIKRDHRFAWTAHYKNGPAIKYAVDMAVYSKNRAWRITFARKEGKTCLVPWDLEHWKELEFSALNYMQSWFEESLCSQPDESCDMFPCPSVLELVELVEQPAPSLTSQVHGTSSAATPSLPAGNEQDRRFVKQVLFLLSRQRAENYEQWIRVGFGMSTVFGRDDDGLQLFQQFSNQAPSYDAASVKRTYQGSGGKIGIGSFITWLREDQPLLAPPLIQEYRSTGLRVEEEDQHMEQPEVLVQTDLQIHVQVQAETREIPNKMDEHHIMGLIDNFNANWRRVEALAEEGMLTKRQLIERAQEKKQLTQDIVMYMNQWLAIIRRETGKPNVFEEYKKWERNEWTREKEPVARFVIRQQVDCEKAYRKFKFCWCDSTLPSNPMSLWLDHRDSREFDSVSFDPKDTFPGEFNMFRGLAITLGMAVEADVTAFTDHIRTIWCKGNNELSEYLLNWMAHLIQFPGTKMCATPVLKGGQGAGKGIIVQILAMILGLPHFMQVTNVEEITGVFQEDKIKTNLLTFMDECTFAGDKKQSSILKGLLTEAWRHWNAKFINPVRVKNCSNYIVASNYDRIVFVETDDRRWLLIEVDDRYAGPQTPESKEYFARLLATDPRHVAHFLYNRDLSSFNPRQIPKTDYQRHQKRINFDSAMVWLNKMLEDGELPSTHAAESRLLNIHDDTILSKADVLDSYRNQHKDQFNHILGEERFFKVIYDALGGTTKDLTCKGPRINGKRKPSLRLPSLTDCRKRFAFKVNDPEWFSQAENEDLD